MAPYSVFIFPFVNPANFFLTNTPLPFIISPKTIERTTRTPTRFFFPFRLSEKLYNRQNENDKTIRCYPTNEVLKPLIGIEDWCLHLCGINCSPTLCICVKI